MWKGGNNNILKFDRVQISTLIVRGMSKLTVSMNPNICDTKMIVWENRKLWTSRFITIRAHEYDDSSIKLSKI